MPTRRPDIKDIMRTDNPVEETEVEIGDYSPLKWWNIEGCAGHWPRGGGAAEPSWGWWRKVSQSAVCLCCIWRDEQGELFGRARRDILGKRDSVSDSREGGTAGAEVWLTRVADSPLAISWVCLILWTCPECLCYPAHYPGCLNYMREWSKDFCLCFSFFLFPLRVPLLFAFFLHW